ncbi:MAG: histidine--tRNA ligase [Planctomycetota bacterium]|jgi:histidyl-tRNA synthetase|nr:histidine--tRNA ligase [Planctomycetota bacterium]
MDEDERLKGAELSFSKTMASDAYQSPRGTRDLLPEELVRVRFLEETARDLARTFHYQEIRTPLFEETRLFSRSLGETSDVVDKEMFTVPPRVEGSLSYSFRPEGTAPAARAYVQGGCPASAPYQKWFYLGPMFRYERPQKGRERQFTQFGVEAFGANSPSLDAEVVDFALRFFEELGFGAELEVRVNTMGDPEDRERWKGQLHDYFKPGLSERCSDCQSRIERNPFRLLDCKVAQCQKLNEGAPSLRSELAEESAAHHAKFVATLEALGRTPKDDPGIVRGLDYYTRTVFEIHYPPLGARSALCGGGRYDGLVEEVGGTPTPAVGFAIGFTATEIAMAELGLPKPEALEPFQRDLQTQVYCVAVSEEDRLATTQLASQLRAARVQGVDLDYRNKSVKAQLKEAAKSGARVVALIGPDERAASCVCLRNMRTRDEKQVPESDLLTELLALLEE